MSSTYVPKKLRQHVAALFFNPREQNWEEHFGWEDSGARIAGKTAVGRATVGGTSRMGGPKVPFMNDS